MLSYKAAIGKFTFSCIIQSIENFEMSNYKIKSYLIFCFRYFFYRMNIFVAVHHAVRFISPLVSEFYNTWYAKENSVKVEITLR